MGEVKGMDTFSIIVIFIVFIVLCVRFANYLIKPVITKIETIICPFCKSRIPRDASVCRYCQREIKKEENEAIRPEDIIAQRELRMEAINKVMDKFRSEYPTVDFQYDTSLGDISINTSSPDNSLKTEDIQLKMIKELIDFGVAAEARFLSKDRIKTRGIMQGVFEETLEKRLKQDTHDEKKYSVRMKCNVKQENLYLAAKELSKDTGIGISEAKEALIKGCVWRFKEKEDAIIFYNKYKQFSCRLKIIKNQEGSS